MALSVRWRLLGERRALALLVLGFYTTVFVLVALAQGGDWALCFGAMALAYGLTFFGVAAEWFWGRWFAMGIATSGMTMALLGLLTNGWNAGLAIWGVLHAAVYLPLLGPDMAQLYEGQRAWRERYQLDDSAVERVKRSVKGAAAALPTLILYALAPRQGATFAAGVWLLLALVGTWGLVRMRVWGVLVLSATAIGVASELVSAAGGLGSASPLSSLSTNPALGETLGGAAAVAGLSPLLIAALALGALLLAAAPFVRPLYQRLRNQPKANL